MRLCNDDGLGRLSRAIAGTRGRALILNTPGSTGGAVETLEAVLDVLPHAVDLLAGGTAALMADAAGLDHDALMGRAVARAAHARLVAPPNPWVGCVVVAPDGTSFEGATERPGGRHAERVALDRAGHRSVGATLYTTLEPCSHHGRTGPCTDAVIEAGVARVVMAVEDPDPNVSGRGGPSCSVRPASR